MSALGEHNDSDRVAQEALRAGTDMLAEVCSQRVLATGAQLAVSVNGSATVSVALGSQVGDRLLGDTHLFNVWCASKPVATIVLMELLEKAGLSLDTPTPEINTVWGNSVSGPVGSVLNHSCGLRRPDLVTANLMPYEDALAKARNRQDTPTVPEFSEFVAGVVIGDLIESLSGKETRIAIDDLLAAHDLTTDITFRVSDEALQRPLDTFGFYITGLPVLARPLYSDALAHMAQHNRDVMGAYANARGLCEFYRLVGLVLNGTPLAGFPSPRYLADALHNHRRARAHDKTLNKTCSFAAGFMTNLADHGYGETISSNAIGHTGLVGSPFGCYDPQRKLAAAAIINGMIPDLQDCDRWRTNLINTISRTTDDCASLG